MYSGPAVTAHSIIRWSSRSSVIPCKRRVGATNLARPMERVTQYPERFVKNRWRNVDLDNSRTSHAEHPNRRASKVQSRDIDVGIKRDSVHSAPALFIAPFPHNLRHIGFDNAGHPAPLLPVSNQIPPRPLLQTIAQSVLD